MTQARAASSLVTQLDSLAETFNHKDVVRYVDKTLLEVPEDARWTIGDVKAQGEAFANGLFQTGMAVGDKFVVWANEDDPVHLVAQFGAAKSGMVMVTLPVEERDPAILSKVLKETNARCLLMSHEHEGHNHLDILMNLEPAFDQTDPLFCEDPVHRSPVSRQFPNLKYILHTAWEDGVTGTHYVKDFMTYGLGPRYLRMASNMVDDASPLVQRYKRGGEAGPVVSHKEAAASGKVLPLLHAVLNRKHTDVGTPRDAAVAHESDIA